MNQHLGKVNIPNLLHKEHIIYGTYEESKRDNI